MSTSNLRVIAAGVAAIVAVLTGILTGVVGAHAGTCTVTRSAASPTTSQPPHQGLAASGGGNEGEGGQQQAQATETTTCPSFSVTTAAVGFVGAALASGVALALLFAGRRPAGSARPGGADPGLAARLEATEGERATLVQTAVYVRDRATSKAIADTLGRALGEAGVTTVAPVGVRFDPAHHEAGGATGTTDPAKVGTIAAVEVPGYLDRGVVLRVPVVTVYREETGQ